MSDLAESGSIEQVAENVLFVYYDYKVNYENSTLGKNKTQIVAAKVRYGENKKLVFGFDGNKVSFIENVDETVNSVDELDDDEAKEFMKRIERFGNLK